MKKIIRITAAVLVLVLTVFAAVSCKKGDDAPKGMKKASDEKADFTLYVPEKWTVDIVEAAVSAYCSADDPSSVSMMAWSLEYSDSTLDEWWDVNLDEIKKVFSDVEVTDTADTLLDGLYAKKYTYTASLGEYDYVIIQAACVKNATVYVFTYTSVPEKFDAHTEEVGEMLSYIKIGK